VRKGSVEDTVFPADYVRWQGATRSSAGKWIESPFFPDSDLHGPSLTGQYSSFVDFNRAVKTYSGKSYQVLLPIQIEDVINDYIFTFRVDSVTTSEKNTAY
jgi:hypothetical protein